MATPPAPSSGPSPGSSALTSARRLPFTARPFFENKARAFWILQAVGWSGYLLLRGVVSISNGL